MKKFFEISVTSRKGVKGEQFARVEAFSEDDKKLGEIILNKVKEDNYEGIFAKYIPEPDCDDEKIARFQIIEDKDDKLKGFMQKVLEQLLMKAKNDSDIFGSMMALFIILPCMDTKNGIIIVPDIFNAEITSKFIIDKIGEDWISLETTFTPEVKKIIKYIANKKKS